jgi:glycosyltransferase involved in cell wall biosynthesis
MTTPAPRVSIVIPTFNRGALVTDAVRSVLGQTYADLEVIVVDDGSTDGTREALAAIADRRLHYLWQENRGRSNARNRALGLARGEYIGFLDSDDVFLPEKVALQVRYLDSHPEVGMVYTSAYCIDEEGNRLAHKYEATASGWVYEDIAFFLPVTVTLPTVMLRREVLDRMGGFDEAMERFEDTDMWRRIARRFKVAALPEHTCLLRTHRGNELAAQDPDRIVAALGYYARKVRAEDRAMGRLVLRRGLGRLYGYYALALLSVPAWARQGRRLLWTSIAYWPPSVVGVIRSRWWRVRSRVNHCLYLARGYLARSPIGRLVRFGLRRGWTRGRGAP